MYSEELKIPKDRIPVLIGKKGVIKKRIQRLAGNRLAIDSKEGDVLIEGEDSLSIFRTKMIIQAIGRGFNPDVALLLMDDSYSLELINIQDFSGKSQKKMVRLKSRLIGTRGKAWKHIERTTECRLSVYGKTIGIIGRIEDVFIARQAIEYLLQGAPHSNVYKFIQEKKKKMKHLF